MQLLTNDIFRKWHRVIFDILASKDSNGKIHFHEVIKAFGSIGGRHADLAKSTREGEDINITSRKFSIICKERASKKLRENQNSRAISKDSQKTISEFWFSNEISRVSPNKTFVIRKRTKNSPTQSVPIFYRKHTITESYELFCVAHPEVKCCKTTFYKFKPRSVKKPKSKQDCCPVCKESKQNLPRLEAMHPSKLTKVEIESMEAYKFHKELAAKRGKDFEKNLNFLKRSSSTSCDGL